MPRSSRPARIFLYIVAGLSLLAIVAVTLFAVFQEDLARFALEPSNPFEDSPMPDAPDYSLPESWAALPGSPGNAQARPPEVTDGPTLPVAIFYLHPTNYRGKQYWNAPVDEPTAARSVRDIYLPNQASAFAGTGALYAPRYRNSSVGVLFYAEPEDMLQSLALAYSDVQRAFNVFLERIGDQPFVLAGHSQGALHLLYLLRDRIAASDLSDRMIAAYVIGWPVTIEADIQPLEGISVCRGPDETGCVISWQSYDPEGDPEKLAQIGRAQPSLFGTSRQEAQILCTNPLTWAVAGAADKTDNLGTLPLSTTGSLGTPPIAGSVGARCGKSGILLLDPVPTKMGFSQFVLPQGNYHFYDINLFWSNLRANVRTRAEAWLAAR